MENWLMQLEDILLLFWPAFSFNMVVTVENTVVVWLFGSICYHKDKKATKHDPAHICIYLGFDATRSANYLIFDTQTQGERLKKAQKRLYL